MDDDNMSYAGSESSSVDENAANLSLHMKNIEAPFSVRSTCKIATIKGHFGKKKRKRVFPVKSKNTDLFETRSSFKLSSSLKHANEVPVIARTSPIFDIQHFQKFLNDVHVWAEGGRLEFIPDISPSVGLFHQNVFRCTKCLKETLMTNFPPSHPIESIQ
ncbi:unnamed protein product [Rotaria sp. Silwood2]|nr:unnamed protein product [Rotaria sp. Silwood2]CAF3050314.1 unnamed protein product [Rotaria sp. Silwood2]CAF3522462.1 unnamed protein product [Rotaria sp. Silwood2]CAF4388290.1 unnamed protein product [Rotaria sp. Silwood2]CAF4586726.1 unnamed protein product [Rotaria sp. Silwood2]